MRVYRRQQKLAKGKECHIQIHTAFVDSHDEFITVLVKATKHPDEHWVILTDDGYIINDLCKSGIKLDSFGGKKLLENILSNFGVIRAEYPTRTDRKSNEITVCANESDFHTRLYKLIKAMLFTAYQYLRKN